LTLDTAIDNSSPRMEKQVDQTVSLMAKLLGSRGGSRNSPAQTAWRKKGAVRMLQQAKRKKLSAKAA